MVRNVRVFLLIYERSPFLGVLLEVSDNGSRPHRYKRKWVGSFAARVVRGGEGVRSGSVGIGEMGSVGYVRRPEAIGVGTEAGNGLK